MHAKGGPLIGDTFQIELEFRSVGFWGEGKTGVHGEKPLGARTKTNNKLNPDMTPSPGIEPGPHRWEANAQPLRHPWNCLPDNINNIPSSNSFRHCIFKLY